MRAVICILLLAAVPGGLVGQTKSDIPSPQQRMKTLDLARTLLTTKTVEPSGDEIAQKNPFNPMQPVAETPRSEAPVVTKSTRLSDREVLMGIADDVTPSGMMKLGNTELLLFGQKKLKVGDSISIVFQGATYEVYISGIERTSFTLRLNKEEIIRPIKPVNTP